MLLKYFPPKNKHGNESTDVGQPVNLYNTTEGVYPLDLKIIWSSGVFRIICGFNFIPWERVIFFYMEVFSWKGRITPGEKN
jgi:hypothetical protein